MLDLVLEANRNATSGQLVRISNLRREPLLGLLEATAVKIFR
jgi:hypothetical protein